MKARVRFLPGGQSIHVERGTSLLEATRRAGLPIARACGEQGLCGRCGLRVLRGGEQLAQESTLERSAKQQNRVDPLDRLACRVSVTGDLEVRASYW